MEHGSSGGRAPADDWPERACEFSGSETGTTAATSIGSNGAGAERSCRPRRSTSHQLLDEKLFDTVDTVGADFRDAGGRGRVRIRKAAAGSARRRGRWWFPAISITPKQALLYVPQTLPDPRSPAFTAAAARGNRRDADAQPRAAPSFCSPAISRCA